MSFHDCLVIEQHNAWLIIVDAESDTLSLDASPAELATCVDVMIKNCGLKNPNCILAPASTSCYFATLRATETDLRDRAALTYALEDHLPIDAESMVADFVVQPSTATEKTISSVAVELHRWRVIADAFEESLIPVRSIIPVAVLATRSICREFNLTDTVELLLMDGDPCDLITVHADTVVAWKHTSTDPNLLRRHKLLEARPSAYIIAVGADDPALRSATEQVYPDIQWEPEPMMSHVISGAELSLAKHSDHWFDLRRGELGPSDPLRPIQSHLRLFTVAAAAFLLAVILGGWWRTQRIENEIASVRVQQQELFKKAFPGTKVPGALLRRVQSEHTRAMSLRGGTSEVEVPQAAPKVLRELLAALPKDVRFRFTGIKVLNGHVDLDLQVRDTVDAGEVAESLAAAGFDVKPPNTTQKDEKTFDSVIEADWVGNQQGSASDDVSARDDVSVSISIAPEVTG